MTHSSEHQEPTAKTGLILPGGGARAAYQIGVLKAISDLLPSRCTNPFPIVVGTSAGAINATALAIFAHRYKVAVGNLERVWRNFEVPQVFESDPVTMFRSGLRWLMSAMSGGWLLPPPPSLLDNAPLRVLLEHNFDFARIDRCIDEGHLEALAISAASYSNSRSVFFFQSGAEKKPWTRVRHAGEPAAITIDHLMASVAVPFLFPAVSMGNEFYGDGSMRQSSPFSPAIHLGADRVLVIATRTGDKQHSFVPVRGPSFGQIFGYMLDALFSDGLYADFERMAQINKIVKQAGPVQINGVTMRAIEMLVIMPSKDLSEIARQHVNCLPRSLRVLLRSMGALNSSGSELMSYIMFQSAYTRELIELGYQDAMAQSEKIVNFMHGEIIDTTGMTRAMRKLDLKHHADNAHSEVTTPREQRTQAK